VYTVLFIFKIAAVRHLGFLNIKISIADGMLIGPEHRRATFHCDSLNDRGDMIY